MTVPLSFSVLDYSAIIAAAETIDMKRIIGVSEKVYTVINEIQTEKMSSVTII